MPSAKPYPAGPGFGGGGHGCNGEHTAWFHARNHLTLPPSGAEPVIIACYPRCIVHTVIQTERGSAFQLTGPLTLLGISKTSRVCGFLPYGAHHPSQPSLQTHNLPCVFPVLLRLSNFHAVSSPSQPLGPPKSQAIFKCPMCPSCYKTCRKSWHLKPSPF